MCKNKGHANNTKSWGGEYLNSKRILSIVLVLFVTKECIFMTYIISNSVRSKFSKLEMFINK